MSLTKYPEGSIRELLSIAFPLMLASLSILLMVFVDRLFLSHFSEAALGAAVTAGTMAWAVMGSLVILASMAEVFVAQYNGAKQYHRIGKPVWQMLWFAILSTPFCFLLVIFGTPLIFQVGPNVPLEREYFSWLVGFGWSWPLLGALAAFFVGRGKTRLLMWLTILANVINMVFDWILIFGIEGWIPSLGMTGAAISTNLGNLVQVGIMLPLFLKKENREAYGTASWRLDWKEMRRCFKVGIPQSVLFMVETVGFAIFYMMIASQGESQIFVAGVAQSVLILFFFVAEGVGRGASAVTGNFIGGQRHGDVYKVLGSGLKVLVIFFGVASIFLVIWPESIISLFFSDRFSPGREMSLFSDPAVRSAMYTTLKICLFYLLFDGIRWLISGILTSAGDTVFLLIAGVLTVPVALLIPAYYFVLKMGVPVQNAFLISVFFAFVTGTVFLWRLMSEKWQRIQLIT